MGADVKTRRLMRLRRLAFLPGIVVLLGLGATAQGQNCTWSPTATTLTTSPGNCLVGIGTATDPTQKLSIGGGHLLFDNGFGLLSAGGAAIKTGSGGLTWNVYPGSPTSKIFGVNDFSQVQVFVVDGTGNVGIGTSSPTARLHVVGNAVFMGTVTGTNIQAQYQDVAEWVPVRQRLAPGTVVVLNPEVGREVRASSTSYDTTVAGVVSASPGVLLGEAGEGKAMIATTGRVKVKADATSASIRVGDLLVTSELEGCAMRSEPIDVAGAKIHRAGTLIGKALEPLEKGQRGEILILLSLQ